MLKRLAVVLLPLITACSGGGSSSSEEDELCMLPITEGTWEASYAETSGNCGPLADEVWNAQTDLPAGCTIYTDELDEDSCTLERVVRCDLLDNDGYRFTTDQVSIVWQLDEDSMEGTFSISAWHEVYGSCKSVYDLKANRLD